MAVERLQKIISRSGLASRRKAEEWIVEGRVSVDGKVVRELGSKADWNTSHIKVDGKSVRPPARLIYLALHKPRGYITTRSDPEGRPTVMDLVKMIKEPVYPAGRLDYHSEGLLLLTNDGDFANRLISSAAGILKTYWVKAKGLPQETEIEKLRQGVSLDGRRTLPARIHLLRKTGGSSRDASANSWYEVVISEGRQNQIRRMFELIGHPVQKLKRTQIGPISLGNLPVGQARHLTPIEIRLVLHGHPAAISALRPARHSVPSGADGLPTSSPAKPRGATERGSRTRDHDRRRKAAAHKGSADGASDARFSRERSPMEHSSGERKNVPGRTGRGSANWGGTRSKALSERSDSPRRGSTSGVRSRGEAGGKRRPAPRKKY